MDMAPYVNSTVSMMGADAEAGVFLFPSARTIIDVGAEGHEFADLDRLLEDHLIERGRHHVVLAVSRGAGISHLVEQL